MKSVTLLASVNQSKPIGAGAYVWLRGLALLAVIGIHVLSSWQWPLFDTAERRLTTAMIDQAFRWSVPFYVLISGFGLSQKYGDKIPAIFEVIWSQFRKLLPAYIIASAGLYLAFQLVPSWHGFPPPRFLSQLLTGGVDYHTYFVWLVAQLYLLFPILAWLKKKLPVGTLLVIALIWQIGWYVWLETPLTSNLRLQFANDQQQYRWWFSWIWYFVLGMQLGPILEWLEKQNWSKLILPFLSLTSYGVIVLLAFNAMQQRTDPLMAMRFSRVSVIGFASIFSITLIWLARRWANIDRPVWLKKMDWLGAWSYPLYLWHTLVLRILVLISQAILK